MTSFLAKLNLRPNELRLVVVVAAVVVAVLYYLFVWPEFAEWEKLKNKRRAMVTNQRAYRMEIEKKGLYERRLRELKQKGKAVDAEAQALDMQRTVYSQATLANLSINSYNPGKGPSTSGGKTNAFFEETTGTIGFVAEESALVNFLYSLSSGDSLIRVASMTLNPDPARMRLQGSMTLVASYPKKPAARTAAPATAVPTPGAKPASSPNAPKSIAAAVAAGKPGATNAPAATSWTAKIKGFFQSKKTSAAPAAPTPKAAATNAPANKPVKP